MLPLNPIISPNDFGVSADLTPATSSVSTWLRRSCWARAAPPGASYTDHTLFNIKIKQNHINKSAMLEKPGAGRAANKSVCC